MKIAVLEKTNFNLEQKSKLEKLGKVDYFYNLSQDEANKIAIQYDIVVVNWLDPSPFILNMRSKSLIALQSTGFGWISNIKEAREKEIYVANIPKYSTEAVAEHLLGMLLGISKNIFCTLNRSDNNKSGFELKNKTIGIIGLGSIGKRFAEIMNFFGANILTYNRTLKNCEIAKDVSLDVLLEQSDVICISCSVTEESKNMINMSNINKIKKGAVIIGSTWGIIEDMALVKALKNKIVEAVSFDAALEGKDNIERELSNFKEKVFITPHIAYNTKEAEKRQLDICVENIVSFVNGTPKNIVD